MKFSEIENKYFPKDNTYCIVGGMKKDKVQLIKFVEQALLFKLPNVYILSVRWRQNEEYSGKKVSCQFQMEGNWLYTNYRKMIIHTCIWINNDRGENGALYNWKILFSHS